jgi:hypothetical protein
MSWVIELFLGIFRALVRSISAVARVGVPRISGISVMRYPGVPRIKRGWHPLNIE